MESRLLKVSHYQAECTPGDFEANLAKVIAGMEHGADEHVHVQSFPESFLTGYFTDPDRARANAFC